MKVMAKLLDLVEPVLAVETVNHLAALGRPFGFELLLADEDGEMLKFRREDLESEYAAVPGDEPQPTLAPEPGPEPCTWVAGAGKES